MTEKGLKYLDDIIRAIELIEDAYDAVDPSMIWAIIKKHLRPLYMEVKELIK